MPFSSALSLLLQLASMAGQAAVSNTACVPQVGMDCCEPTCPPHDSTMMPDRALHRVCSVLTDNLDQCKGQWMS